MNIAVRTKIKRLREEKGISQSDMAEKLNMDERNYKRIESGERKTMDLDMLGRIAEVLEIDMPELLTNETLIFENNSTHDNSTGNYGNVTNNYSFPPELKEGYAATIMQQNEIIAQCRKTIEQNNQLITALIEQMKK